mmetsp:Transcript_728/g.2100  ORF Transcript_728/g.2100 Transcript_728/m.2100 type:complete len:126 (+) Transcript_728:965-1342(+)
MTGYIPLSSHAHGINATRKTTVLDVMRQLLQTKNIMVSSNMREKEFEESKYISILNVIQGNVDAFQVLLESYEYFLSDISVVVFICLFILTLCNILSEVFLLEKTCLHFSFFRFTRVYKEFGRRN